ncbi:MAG: GNAT family N-acetyltransferase [Chloroflexi bacterium]|nr:GNAT family N-acetyltransferase [Chloroflexota bacterium]
MPTITSAKREDSDRILSIATEVGVFSPTEIATVGELLQDSLTKSDGGGYTFLVYRDEAGQVLGFTVYGPHPLTAGTYDLYWLCVSTSAQGHGVGTALLRRVEEDLQALGGRLLIAETSSTPGYGPARRFYERHGFAREAVIRDFYAPGDSLVIYTKHIQ